MEQKIRLLGIAPYSEMRPLMLEVSKEYQDIDLTVYVGDLQKGVEMARRNFYNDYDVIISRGGTATMLRERLAPGNAVGGAGIRPLCDCRFSQCDHKRKAAV